LSYEQILDTVDLLIPRGVRKVRITGGEPLVRRGVLGLFRRLGDRPLQELTLTTNGILLEKHAEALLEAGVHRVNVSLDSLRPGRYREITGGDELHRVLRGIDRARELGMVVKLNTVVMRGMNLDEVANLLEFGMDKGCHVRFIEIMPHAHNALMHRRLFVPMQEVLGILRGELHIEELQPDQAGNGSSTEWLYRVEDGPGTFGLISPLSRHFCGRCDKIRITAEGRLKTCLFQEGVSLRETLAAYRCGDGGRMLLGIVEEALARKPAGHRLARMDEAEGTGEGPDLIMHQTGG
jgi:cyclic pyranopterin phosphate synthase